MSLFRKPKKIQRRVFSSNADDDDNTTPMEVDGVLETPPPPIISLSGKRDKDKNKKTIKQSDDNGKPKALLSFADDGERISKQLAIMKVINID